MKFGREERNGPLLRAKFHLEACVRLVRGPQLKSEGALLKLFRRIPPSVPLHTFNTLLALINVTDYGRVYK